MKLFVICSIIIFVIEIYALLYLCKVYFNTRNIQNNIINYNFGAIEVEEIPPNYETSIDIPNYIESEENINLQSPPPY